MLHRKTRNVPTWKVGWQNVEAQFIPLVRLQQEFGLLINYHKSFKFKKIRYKFTIYKYQFLKASKIYLLILLSKHIQKFLEIILDSHLLGCWNV